MDDILIKTSTISKALGISGAAVRKRSRRQQWLTCGKKTQGGGKRYLLGDIQKYLTADEINKVIVSFLDSFPGGRV